MKALQVLWSKDVTVTAGQQVLPPVSWWLSLPPQRGRVIPCQSDLMLWTFNQLKKYSLLQDDNLTDKSAVCFLFTGTRWAINKGLGTAQGQGTGPSWLSVYKYR